jgi:hypothetical protein
MTVTSVVPSFTIPTPGTSVSREVVVMTFSQAHLGLVQTCLLIDSAFSSERRFVCIGGHLRHCSPSPRAHLNPWERHSVAFVVSKHPNCIGSALTRDLPLVPHPQRHSFAPHSEPIAATALNERQRLSQLRERMWVDHHSPSAQVFIEPRDHIGLTHNALGSSGPSATYWSAKTLPQPLRQTHPTSLRLGLLRS